MSPVDSDRSEPDAALPGAADAVPSEAETVDRLRAEIDDLRAIIARQATLIGQLKKNNDDLRALKFGKRSEKLTPGQLALGLEGWFW
jgi:hypothetical protein